jgi:hypothetical protein
VIILAFLQIRGLHTSRAVANLSATIVTKLASYIEEPFKHEEQQPWQKMGIISGLDVLLLMEDFNRTGKLQEIMIMNDGEGSFFNILTLKAQIVDMNNSLPYGGESP